MQILRRVWAAVSSGVAADNRLAQLQSYNIWFDWLRFLAALAVVLTHTRTRLFVEYSELEASSRTIFTTLWYSLTRQGHEAVLVFFVLSGFLVGGPAIRRALSKDFKPLDYALDRCVRILVPLVPAIMLTGFVAAWIGLPMEVFNIAGTLLSLQGVVVPVPEANYALWSLSYEVWFYVLGGAIAYAISHRAGLALWPLLVMAVAIAVLSQLKILYTFIWFAGAAAFVFRSSIPRPVILIGGAVLAFLGTATYQLTKPNTLIEDATAGIGFGIVAGEILLSIGVALFLSSLSSVRTRFDSNRIIRWGRPLAGFSYSLYLIHLPVLKLQPIVDWKEVTVTTFSYYLLTVFACLFAAFMFSRLFEMTGPSIKTMLRRTATGPT
ncbi:MULTISPECIES: acyltransferase [unclassified Mesorhizobium]|uniref:acyltransferase family protein n=1 Tax=unclassified Mesorhizobium TaxID=325217 RepID=UPI003339F86D